MTLNATDLFRAGKLHDAIDAQLKAVKKAPADHGARIFLFELLCFAGDLDRAQRQMETVKYEEMERETAVMFYRKALDAERLRRRLFSEGLSPKFFLDPPPEHVNWRLEALNCLRGGQQAQAAELLARADQAAPALKGQLNDKEFDSLRDCDDLFGPVLEVMAHGEYFWLPLEQVDSIAHAPPKSPRDLLWAPVRMDIRNGPTGDAFIPVLYPGSHEHNDDQIKLGRITDWSAPTTGPVRGQGLRMFLFGDDAVSVLELQQLQME